MAMPLTTGTQLERFTGIAPVFPLPSVALLPNVVQPLHVFEPRYRLLTEQALAGPRLIAMAVLRPGWEARYEQNDLPLYPVVCLSQIEVDKRLPDGRYVLLLRGLVRARMISELPATQSFRQARLQLLPDVYSPPPMIDRPRRRRELLELFLQLNPGCGELADLPLVADGELSLGALCDVLSFAAGLDTAEMLELLHEPRIDVRSDLLLDILRRRVRAAASSVTADFPPSFSWN
ncbi:MAG: LON peptidase substrate-binding domain-containing protein [Planctomycetaceae bacterium]|nr:LON peptidase substrate-binding domain-containing protein [Planctomycetaceae bacterium]